MILLESRSTGEADVSSDYIGSLVMKALLRMTKSAISLRFQFTKILRMLATLKIL